MAQPYVGEIRMFAGFFQPVGWMFCEGQLLPIAENDVLYLVLGTRYGGDGNETFALPDLRGRLATHQGPTMPLGQAGGVQEVTLTTGNMPSHTHPVLASTTVGAASAPAGQVLAASGSSNLYRPAPAATAMAVQTVGPAGGSQPHTNIQPYTCVSYIISLFGILPREN